MTNATAEIKFAREAFEAGNYEISNAALTMAAALLSADAFMSGNSADTELNLIEELRALNMEAMAS